MAFKMSAVKREIKGEKVRKEGLLPAVIYGAGGENDSLSLSYNEFSKIYNEAGESSLVDLDVDNKDFGKILIHDVQYDPVSGRVSHVDLLRIDMNKPISASVELRFVGESAAIKEAGGTLVKNIEHVEIECLPKDLLNHIDVDLSVLKTFDNSVTVADLNIPSGVTIIEPSAETTVVKAVPAMTEEEIKAMEAESVAAVDVTKIESAAPKKEKDGEGDGAEAKEEKK